MRDPYTAHTPPPLRPPSWDDEAVCRAHGRYPVPPRGVDPARYAHDYCAGCTVIRECAQDAIDTRSIGVVRAGIFVRARGRKPNPEMTTYLAEIAGGSA